MAIILPSGFNILNNEPVDARLTLADENARYALSSANVYEGLIVFQQDNDTIWVLTDTTNVGNSNGWTQLQIGSVSSNLPNGVVSGSSQLTSSYDNRYVALEGDQTIGSTKTFNNIVVNGTGSFAFIQSTTGSSTSIGEAFIILNENTPSSNFAGIKVVDSGSTFTTASFLYDGTNNNWVFQHEGSSASGSSLAIFGPLSQGGLGTEVGLTENRIPKGVTDHGHHIGDSNITDTGTLITLGSNSVVNGTFYASGTTLVSGSSQISYPNLSNIPAGIVSGSSQVTPLLPSGVVSGSSQVNIYDLENFSTFNDAISGDINGKEEVASATHTLVSGSSQIITANSVTLGTHTTGSYVEAISGSANQIIVAGSGLESAVVTLSLPQNIHTSANPQFNSLGIGTAASTTAGEIRATGDITAFYSSDIRLKENIQPIQNALEKVESISGNTYDWKEGYDGVHSHKGNDVGVIAQEIEQILPQIVTNRDNGFKAVQYEKIIPLLIEAIKELSTKIKVLENK